MATTSLSSWSTVATLLSVVLLAGIASAAYDGVVADHFMRLNPRSGSRFLAGSAKKGDSCNPADGSNTCSATPAKDGSQLLSCCKNHCRNVLSDRNNCGACGNTCGFGQLCCGGNCTVVAYDVGNCGECGTVCKPGLKCEYGSCGYA